MNWIDRYKSCKVTEKDQWPDKQGHHNNGKKNSKNALVERLSRNANRLLCIPDIAVLSRIHVKVILEALPCLEEIKSSFTECVIN